MEREHPDDGAPEEPQVFNAGRELSGVEELEAEVNVCERLAIDAGRESTDYRDLAVGLRALHRALPRELEVVADRALRTIVQQARFWRLQHQRRG